jgi:hypothetical protein
MFCFLLCVFCVFVLFCVLFLLMYTVVSFLFVYKFTDHCHRVGTQLQLIKIMSYKITDCELRRFITTLSVSLPPSQFHYQPLSCIISLSFSLPAYQFHYQPLSCIISLSVSLPPSPFHYQPLSFITTLSVSLSAYQFHYQPISFITSLSFSLPASRFHFQPLTGPFCPLTAQKNRVLLVTNTKTSNPPNEIIFSHIL